MATWFMTKTFPIHLWRTYKRGTLLTFGGSTEQARHKHRVLVRNRYNIDWIFQMGILSTRLTLTAYGTTQIGGSWPSYSQKVLPDRQQTSYDRPIDNWPASERLNTHAHTHRNTHKPECWFITIEQYGIRTSNLDSIEAIIPVFFIIRSSALQGEIMTLIRLVLSSSLNYSISPDTWTTLFISCS